MFKFMNVETPPCHCEEVSDEAICNSEVEIAASLLLLAMTSWGDFL